MFVDSGGLERGETMIIDWGILGVLLTIIFGVLGIILAMLGLKVINKKNTINIKTKSKDGNQDFSNSTIANEIHNKEDK